MCTTPPTQVKGNVLPFCCLDNELRAFWLPSRAEVAEKRVVVASCIAAGTLREGAYADPQPLQFSHVFIDEAGQVSASRLYGSELPALVQLNGPLASYLTAGQ